MRLGAASPTAFAQHALTEVRPLGLGSSELTGLFGGGGGHIQSPHDAALGGL